LEGKLLVETDEKKRRRIEKTIENTRSKLVSFVELLKKVSPSPVFAEKGAGVGVEAIFPGLPSLSPGDETSPRRPEGRGIGKAQSRNGQFRQVSPTYTAKFNLKNWSIVQTRCS
jgi:hypothetical protein